MVYNLTYGPWEGCMWFEELKAGAAEYFQKEQASSPLFQALFQALCRDRGEEPFGGFDQQQTILEEAVDSEAFSRKGPKVTLR
eukprot:9843666-Lingulodinium_polyedra.AAC.1